MSIKSIKNPNPTQNDMRQSTFRGRQCACYLTSEIWREIREDSIQPWYYVSNYGRVYSKLYNCLLRPRLVGHGYLIVTLRAKDNTSADRLVHRLVLMAFDPSSELLQVNHIDGNKLNNFYGNDPFHIDQSNLEWVTSKENNMHAIQSGLRKIGEDASFSVLNNNQVRKICEALELGYSYSEVYKYAEIPNTNRYKAIIAQIKARKNWTRISKDYNF